MNSKHNSHYKQKVKYFGGRQSPKQMHVPPTLTKNPPLIIPTMLPLEKSPFPSLYSTATGGGRNNV